MEIRLNQREIHDNELASYINQWILKSGYFRRAIANNAGLESMQLLSLFDLLYRVDSD